MAKRQTEEQVFRERIAECPYLWAVQSHWTRKFTELRMSTLDEGILLRPCEPPDLEKLEVFVYHTSEEIRPDRRRRGTGAMGNPPETAIGEIWHFVGGRNLAYEISMVCWGGAVMDIVIAHRHSFNYGRERRGKDLCYAVVEVYRGRDMDRVAELIAKTQRLIPVTSASM